jgi:hypothetical protein
MSVSHNAALLSAVFMSSAASGDVIGDLRAIPDTISAGELSALPMEVSVTSDPGYYGAIIVGGQGTLLSRIQHQSLWAPLCGRRHDQRKGVLDTVQQSWHLLGMGNRRYNLQRILHRSS